MTPPSELLRHLLDDLRQHEPFKHMGQAALRALLVGVRESYFAPDETVLAPESGVPTRLYLVRRGAARGHADHGAVFALERGDMFSLGALLGARATRCRYVAEGDLFCLEFDAASVRLALALDAALADHVHHRLQSLLALSQAELQASHASQLLAQQSFEAPLATLARRTPVAVGADASLHQALRAMQTQRVGSVLVLAPDGAALGILTRHDLLERVVLREPPPELHRLPVSAVMSQPVHTLDIGARVHDAALLMSRHGIRHVPVCEGGRVVSVLSERDLFSLQKLSLKALSGALRQAGDITTLRARAADIRELARQLLAQGLAAARLTALISHLNDVLCQRLVTLLAAAQGLDMQRACWLAFGSEGREEQTIATDQDNGLLLADDVGEAERARWLALGRSVNQALADCGYPLCLGGVMAGNEACCLRQHEWLARFAHWLEHGAPADLLNASIYFDLRVLIGHAALAEPLRELVRTRAVALPRFIHQLAANAMQRRPALNWRGAIDTTRDDHGEWVDLKLGGSAVLVDGARVLALAQGITALGTAERLLAAGAALGVPAEEHEAWAGAFEVLQMLRLRAQVEPERGQAKANQIRVDRLNDIDRRLLKEALQVARRVQQRIAMDWLR